MSHAKPKKPAFEGKECIMCPGNPCDNCGLCNYCDLDPTKICDNCMKCLDMADYNGVMIDKVGDKPVKK